MIILGLDPDRGYALVRRGIIGDDGGYRENDTQILAAGTVKGLTDLKKIIIDCRRYARDDDIDFCDFTIRIERPVNLKTFPRPGLSYAAMMKIAHNCGMNYQKATELGEYCTGMGLRCEFVTPAKKKWGKMPWKEFNRLTGYNGRTSEHSRDAIAIALHPIIRGK